MKGSGFLLCLGALLFAGEDQQQADTLPAERTLPPEVSAEIRDIVLSQLKKVVDLQARSLQTIPEGFELELTLKEKKYSAECLRPFGVFLLSGKLVANRFFIRTIEDWELKCGTVIPAGTCIEFNGTFCRVLDPSKRETPSPSELVFKTELTEQQKEKLKPILEKDQILFNLYRKRVLEFGRKQEEELKKKYQGKWNQIEQNIRSLTETCKRKLRARQQKLKESSDSKSKTTHFYRSLGIIMPGDQSNMNFNDGLERDVQQLKRAKKLRSKLKKLIKREKSKIQAKVRTKLTRLKRAWEANQKEILSGKTLTEEALKSSYESCLKEEELNKK